jgi:hypothetical protein
MSHVTHERYKRHGLVPDIHVLRMSHVTHTNESCPANESHTNESCNAIKDTASFQIVMSCERFTYE